MEHVAIFTNDDHQWKFYGMFSSDAVESELLHLRLHNREVTTLPIKSQSEIPELESFLNDSL